MPEAAIQQMRAARPSSDLLVFEDCWPAVAAFCALSTQWNVVAAGMGGLFYVGLRYEAIPDVLDEIGVPAGERAAVRADLRLMEAEALKVINKG